MSKQMILIGECPYCDGGGEVYLDTREADETHIRQISIGDFDVGADQRLVIYNSDSADRKPCEHVVDLYGHFDWDGGPVESNNCPITEICFGWQSPILDEVDADRSAWGHLLDLFDSNLDQKRWRTREERAAAEADFLYAYQPNSLYRGDWYGDCWLDATTGFKPRQIQLAGKIIFADDIRELFEELRIGWEKRESDWRAKQTT